MRRFDKLKNMQKINLLTEQRYINRLNEDDSMSSAFMDQSSPEMTDNTFEDRNNIVNDILTFPSELEIINTNIGYDSFKVKFEIISTSKIFVDVMGKFEKDGYENFDYLIDIKEVNIHDEAGELIAKLTNSFSEKFEQRVYDAIIDDVIKSDQGHGIDGPDDDDYDPSRGNAREWGGIDW
jgi:hypothetical protein